MEEKKMKKLAMRLLVLLMVMSTMLTTLLPPMQAQAAEVSSDAKRFNIMLVIDGSGSLEAQKKDNTDPSGMRFELIGDLFGILEDDGHCIGAIVFSGNETADTSDEGMLSGIKLDTGLWSLDDRGPGNADVKDYLEREIKGVNVTGSNIKATDVGTALLYAEEQLEAKCAENGLPGLIFLFTDGETEFPSVYGDTYGDNRTAISLQNRNEATSTMATNGTRLFGVFLNKGGRSDSTEVADIVCSANGINVNSPEFDYSYVEITDANSAHKAVNAFLKFLGYIHDDDFIELYDDFTDKFTIPGVGVEEMNIRLYSPSGESLPNLKVTITQPDGTTISGVPLRSSRTYRVYKLVDPMPGEWTLEITVPKGNTVGYVYSPVVSLQVDALTQTTPDAAQLHVNMDGQFTALLTKNGTVLTDSASYRGYDCTLKLTNLGTGKEASYPIAPNAAGQFIQTLPLDTYGTFEAQVVFTCEKIVVASPVVQLDLRNRDPISVGTEKKNILYGLFQSRDTVLDMTQYITDPEDGTNLTYTVTGGTCNAAAAAVQGTDLVITNKSIGDGELTITATDSQGGTAQLQLIINSQSATMKYLLILLGILVSAALITALVIYLGNKIKPDGTLDVRFDCRINGREHTISLELDVPGASAESKTTLGKLIRSVLRDDDVRIERGIYASDVKPALDEAFGELDKIVVSKTTKKRGKSKYGAIMVKQGAKKQVLLDSSIEIYAGDESFLLTYSRNSEDDIDIFDGSTDFDYKPASRSGWGKKKSEPADDLFDDLF